MACLAEPHTCCAQSPKEAAPSPLNNLAEIYQPAAA